MWVTRLGKSRSAITLARNFGAHGDPSEGFKVRSTVDQQYVDHYAPSTIAREDGRRSPVVRPGAKKEAGGCSSSLACRVWDRVKPYVLLDPLFDRIMSDKAKNSGVPTDPEFDQVAKYYASLSPSQRYMAYLLDIYKRTESPSKFTAFNMLKNLSQGWSKSILRYLYKETDLVNCEREIAEEYNPPKIHENAVFLYQSTARANKMRRARLAELPLIVGLYLTLPSPIVTTVFLASIYFLNVRAMHFEPANRFVTRMDLLPHLEMVAFQKVGLFGRPVTKLVRIKDLEKIKPEFNKENALWGYNIDFDVDLVFRDKTTGEQFVFDAKGYWSWEGISHKQLY